MITSIELQVICRILTSENETEIDTLCSFDSSYYSAYSNQIEFILDHRQKYGEVPDVFTFQVQFPNITIIKVNEPTTYLCRTLRKNKKHIILLNLFNKIKDLGSDDTDDAWRYIQSQCDKVMNLDDSQPMNIIKQAKQRAETVKRYAGQTRIPTGFPEIDKLMYGGLSTVEEFLLLVARTNAGKSWILTKMMEAAQKAGFRVLFYSPEMQSEYIGARFDTWRGHFQNSQLYQGKYTEEYLQYLETLEADDVGAFVLEDKHAPDGKVDVPYIKSLVKRLNIDLVVVDGLSYLQDARSGNNRTDSTSIKYKNICEDLFNMSKEFHCAVVASVQANRETREYKDDKGEPFPNLFTISESDHPARIATQAFAVRQIFEKHVIDIRLEKTRIANNQKPILSYAWDVNTGNTQFLPGGADDATTSALAPVSISGSIATHNMASDNNILESEEDWDDDVEF